MGMASEARSERHESRVSNNPPVTCREAERAASRRSSADRSYQPPLEAEAKESRMTATCPLCESTFGNVDRNEDGSPAIEITRCAHPGCAVYLCRAGCEHLSFQCEGCRKRFC